MEEVAGVYAETKILELGGPETSVRLSETRPARKPMTRMKTIALIDARLEIPEVNREDKGAFRLFIRAGP
jgi:hypothetical protein